MQESPGQGMEGWQACSGQDWLAVGRVRYPKGGAEQAEIRKSRPFLKQESRKVTIGKSNLIYR